MITIDIYRNYNGKLFCDNFSHVTIYSPELNPGDEVKITHRGLEMGIATVEALSHLPFSRINDALSFVNMGKSSQYQAAELNRMHNGGQTLAADAMISHIVFGYTERNIENQTQLIKEWWDSKKLNYI